LDLSLIAIWTSGDEKRKKVSRIKTTSAKLGTIFIGLIVILVCEHSSAQTYKWVDEKGTVHFTDDISKMPEQYRPSVSPMQKKSGPSTKTKKATGVNYSTGAGLCSEIERSINGLVNYTNTQCLPAAGSRKETTSLILISSQPIFNVKTLKKAWLTTVVGAVGEVIANHPSAKVGKIFVSDVTLMQYRKGFVLSGEIAKRLHGKTSNQEIDLEELYLQINRAIKRTDIP
jgi:hypothetical protein